MIPSDPSGPLGASPMVASFGCCGMFCLFFARHWLRITESPSCFSFHLLHIVVNLRCVHPHSGRNVSRSADPQGVPKRLRSSATAGGDDPNLLLHLPWLGTHGGSLSWLVSIYGIPFHAKVCPHSPVKTVDVSSILRRSQWMGMCFHESQVHSADRYHRWDVGNGQNSRLTFENFTYLSCGFWFSIRAREREREIYIYIYRAEDWSLESA